ncbi:MAG: hypothetical protein GY811_03860 [Myxococcales bacterium]|nr:hypothetical protein [Myxococcales bacterium]
MRASSRRCAALGTPRASAQIQLMQLTRRQLLAGTLATAGLISLPAGATPPPSFQIGMWLRLNKRRTEDEWREYFELLGRAGVQSILPQVYQNRKARYESKVLPVQRGVLETILRLATSAGLQVHGWMHTMLCKVPSVLKEHPEWFAVSASGKSTVDNPPYTQHYRFLCPTRPAVCRFLLSIVDELCAYDKLSGVHLDFVRHPDVFLPAKFARKRNQPSDRVLPDNDFCYCEVCRETFEKESLSPIVGQTLSQSSLLFGRRGSYLFVLDW